MKINTKHFRVQTGEKVNLDKWLTKVDAVYKSNKDYDKHLKKQVQELSALQLVSCNSDSVLRRMLSFHSAEYASLFRPTVLPLHLPISILRKFQVNIPL